MDTKEVLVTVMAGIVRELDQLKIEDLQEIATILRQFTGHDALAQKITFLAQAKQVMETLERNY
jgi:hypothetical protein